MQAAVNATGSSALKSGMSFLKICSCRFFVPVEITTF